MKDFPVTFFRKFCLFIGTFVETMEKFFYIIYNCVAFFLKVEGGDIMTQPELVLRLVELLLAERDKNNQMKVELEKTKEKAK